MKKFHAGCNFEYTETEEQKAKIIQIIDEKYTRKRGQRRPATPAPPAPMHIASEQKVPIRSNGTVPARVLASIDWNKPSKATRKLLETVFSRDILATHTLSGKPSSAFPGKPTKNRLNPILIKDIVTTVSRRTRVSKSMVKHYITIKCADESKMSRIRQGSSNMEQEDQENVQPSTSSSHQIHRRSRNNV